MIRLMHRRARMRVVFLLPFLALALLVAGGAGAQDMTFRSVSNGGNCATCGWIAAEGAITKETPAVFEAFAQERTYGGQVVFHSPGGDLAAAIALGRSIREKGYGTGVGDTVNTDPDSEFGNYNLQPGRCESACAFAFMGGIYRSAADHPDLIEARQGQLGVHQFFRRSSSEIPSSATQQIMGQLLLYVLDMGISPEVLSIASDTPADTMYHFTKEELSLYNLHTTAQNTTMELVAERDGLALTWDVLYRSGELDRRAHLYCDLRYNAWLLRVVDMGRGSLGFNRDAPRALRFGVRDTNHKLTSAYIVALDEYDDAWSLTVRLPVDLRQHPGAPFDFSTSGLRNWVNHLSARGTLPDADTLTVLSRTCVRS